MGLMSFMKEAGEKLFGIGEAKAAETAVKSAPTPENIAAMSAAAGKAISDYIGTQNLPVEGLNVSFDAPSGVVAVSGTVADQATKEKVLLCCGNVAGVSSVNDMLVVNAPEPESSWHTVVSGDTLSKIAKTAYGDAMKYPVIFEANKPMLKHPDKIYPGQLLRIPPL
jgi:nucleoid-associated protein YgaU